MNLKFFEDAYILVRFDQVFDVSRYARVKVLNSSGVKTFRAGGQLRGTVAIPWDESEVEPIAEDRQISSVCFSLMAELVRAQRASENLYWNSHSILLHIPQIELNLPSIPATNISYHN